MKFDAARAEGERVVAELLRRFRQDTGNAKWIGRMALSKVEQTLSAFGKNNSATSPSTSESADEPSSTEDAGVPSAPPLSTWSILSASELIEYLASCSKEDAIRILDEERLKLQRASVIEAANRRLSQ